MVPGQVVGNRFRLERVAGTGGASTVFLAVDQQTGGPVALKVLRGDLGPDVSRRFALEARLLSELHHPAMVRYVAHGTTVDDTHWLAMEWLDGEDLDQRLARGPLDVASTLALLERVASALAEAHARGVVHRDIKPANIFLVGGSVRDVRVLDFGVARDLLALRRATRTGLLVGTPGYMAPEQARGDRLLDARTDVFALGCVAFECLTGVAAFESDSLVALLSKVLVDHPPPVSSLAPHVPDGLDGLIEQMLAKAPEERFSGGAAVATAVAALARAASPERASWTPARPTLTADEQRWISVLLAGEAAPDAWSDATLTDAAVDASQAALVQAARGYGARTEVLANGTLLATLAGTGVATDRAAQAARCALALAALAPERPVVLATGRGVVAHREPTGEALDRAAALLSSEQLRAREAGTVRLDEITAGLLDARFELTERAGDGRVVLRGERDVGDFGRTLLGRSTPFVGREREMSLLLGIFEECAREPAARCAAVVAAPGVGKSRLFREFLARVGDRATALVARGDALGAGSPMALIADLVRAATGIRGGEPVASRLQKLQATLGPSLAGDARERVAGFLAELVGGVGSVAGPAMEAARRDPRLYADQLARAFRDWIAAAAEARPVVLVLEDLHWGDLPSVQIVEGMLRALASRPVMVLALARPEVERVFPRLWAARGVTEVRLGELSPRASEQLVRAVLGDDCDAAAIARRAGGNAFYLEELVRAVSAGRSDALPETVLAMAGSRVASLPPEDRQILRAASVYGPTFWEGAVAALLGSMRRADLSSRLAALVRDEVLTDFGQGRFPAEVEYGFRHNLALDAAYATLTDDDRALGHRLAGAWLEAHHEPDALTLAEHAGRGGERARAAGFFAQAAEQALQGNDLDGALTRARRGIECGAESEARGELLRLMVTAHAWRGEMADVVRCAEEALTLLARGGRSWCAVVSDLILAVRRLGQRARLTALCDELEALAANGPQSAPLVLAIARAAAALWYAGEHERSAALTRWVEAHGDAAVANDIPAAVTLELFRAFVCLYGGDEAQSVARKERAAQWFEAMGDVRNAALHRMHNACTILSLGRYAEAERALAESIEAGERLGLTHFVMTARSNRALALANLWRIDDALGEEALAIAGFEALGDRRMQASARVDLARIHNLAMDFAAGEREARAVLSEADVASSSMALAEAALAEALLGDGRLQEARGFAASAIARLEAPPGIEEGEGYVRLTHVRTLLTAGQDDEVRAALGRAAAWLSARAARISDDAMRESFLREVPENARLAELAAQWSVGG